jgi:uncharacterized protein GlcG (DUF336 family)
LRDQLMNKKLSYNVKLTLVGIALCTASGVAQATNNGACQYLPGHAQLKAALDSAVTDESSGFDLQMWATIVNRDGVVCAVAFSGANRGDQWPGSRVISAQKANTANAFSLPGLALSTANLYSAVQPGGSLYGLQHSNPVDAEVAYGPNPSQYGQPNDPLVGTQVGGVNVFGGGLSLYRGGKIKGGLGLSGDTSCADHMIAWRVRHYLGLDHVPAGVSGDAARPDNIVYDITPNPKGGTGKSAGGWGHPTCVNTGNQNALPAIP